MTIRKGIEPGDFLWKEKESYIAHRWVTNDQGRHVQERYEVERHFAIVLETRRARSVGCQIKPELKPFFEQLRIRLTPVRVYDRRHSPNHLFEYIAVGTRRQRISKEQYDEQPLSSVASRYYRTITNVHLMPFLERYEEPFSAQLLEDMRTALQDYAPEEDPAVIEWPIEPRMQEPHQELNRYASPSMW